MMSQEFALFGYFAGLFTIAAAWLDWDWFFRQAKAKFFVDTFGRQGARRFYALLGAAILLITFLSCKK